MSDSIFPYVFVPKTEKLEKKQSLPREYAWDFNRNEFILEDGKFKVVEGLDAIRVWIYKLFRTKRYRYLIYSWDYGHELEDFIGSEYSKRAVQSEVKRHLQEALALNPHIKGVANVETIFDGDVLSINFTAITDYGEVIMSV